MNKRSLLDITLAWGLAGALFSILVVVVRAVPDARPTNVAPQVWKATEGNGESDFLVVLDEQADLSAAAALANREARLRKVYDALRTTALRSQSALRADLDAANVAYRPFYIVNMLAVRGERDLLTRLAHRPEVSRIVANPQVRHVLPEPTTDQVHALTPQGVEWNITQINADDVWALGYTGEGTVVAGQDTGYDWDHPALIDQYRGSNGVTATHDYNWHDAIHGDGGSCRADSPEPCDDHGHGTHTMGTIVGDDGGTNQIGVAPGARWIGCRNMDRGVGTPATYAECFEFFLAPYPIGGDALNDGNPSLAPHVINNSWTCPPSEGCDWNTLQSVVENVRAAGILVVASAGNSGPNCSTVQDPPAIYDAAFSVGATSSGDTIASFSSRGSVTADGSGRLKPDVSAPGVSVRSSQRGGGYTYMSGTSMAGPHVAGALSLLWSAEPALIGNVDASERVITGTARPRTTSQGCGGDTSEDVPNNVYGWGIVDALAAVRETAGLKIIKHAHSDPVQAGARLTYTLSITNNDQITLTTTITDLLPNHVTPTGVLTWSPDPLPPGGGWTETVAVTVDMDYTGPLTNVVRATTEEGATGAYTVTTTSLAPRMEVSKQVALPEGLLIRSLDYTLTVTNASPFTLTGIVLTDVLPMSTTFARAHVNVTQANGIVTWTAESLAPWGRLTTTLTITGEGLSPGARVVNADYGAHAEEVAGPVKGAAVEVIIPWRCLLHPIFKNWSTEGDDDA